MSYRGYAAPYGSHLIVTDSEVTFADINLAAGEGSSSTTVLLKSRCEVPLKFDLKAAEDVPNCLSFEPSSGHLAPGSSKEINVKFTSKESMKLEAATVNIQLQQIAYINTKPGETLEDGTETTIEISEEERSLQGKWDTGHRKGHHRHADAYHRRGLRRSGHRG